MTKINLNSSTLKLRPHAIWNHHQLATFWWQHWRCFSFSLCTKYVQYSQYFNTLDTLVMINNFITFHCIYSLI